MTGESLTSQAAGVLRPVIRMASRAGSMGRPAGSPAPGRNTGPISNSASESAARFFSTLSSTEAVRLRRRTLRSGVIGLINAHIIRLQVRAYRVQQIEAAFAFRRGQAVADHLLQAKVGQQVAGVLLPLEGGVAASAEAAGRPCACRGCGHSRRCGRSPPAHPPGRRCPRRCPGGWAAFWPSPASSLTVHLNSSRSRSATISSASRSMPSSRA